MLLTYDHPDIETTIVLLDGKACKAFISANDEEGWVELPDIKAMAPLDLTNVGVPAVDEEIALAEWNEIPVVRKQGKVEFVKLNPIKK